MLVAAFPDWVREDFFHADGNDIFVMGTVEDGDLPFGGDFFVNAPQEIVVQFLSSGFFEGYYVQPLRIHPGEDMLDAAVLAPCIHSLKNNQNFVLVLGKKFFLQFLQFFPQFVEFNQGFFLGSGEKRFVIRRIIL